MERQYIVLVEEMYGAATFTHIEVPGTLEILKKVWKHFCKVTRYMDNIEVYAYVVTKDGITEDWSMRWCCMEMEYMCNAGVIPFCR